MLKDNLHTEKAVLELNLDGIPSRVVVDATELATVHLPVLHDLERQWHKRRGRLVVFLSGPPGSGKTTLAGIWEQLARQGRIAVPVQALSMDGFHYPNQVLDSQQINLEGTQMPLRRIKGRPETFDLPSIRQLLHSMKAEEQVLCPRYDRMLHDPIPGDIPVISEGIVIVEGLYMLLDLPGWKELRTTADYGIFIECPEDMLRADLLDRKHSRGWSLEDAAAHYDLVDHYTWRLTMRHRQRTDVLIRIGPGRRMEIVPGAHE